MSFKDFFKKTKSVDEESPSALISPTEEQFIDNSEPEKNEGKNSDVGLQSIYDYALIDFEHRGYQDALINPDSSYKSENLELLIEDLYIKIRIAKRFYKDLSKNMDFHIQSRSDAGLVDTVNELNIKKILIEEKLEEVTLIESETNQEKGISIRLSLSYSKGFKRGLASLSKELLNIKL
tara:strand:+ start:331 stop:867 length:537 start_codon:yes stop_codon:yes gene_type:complete